MFQTLKNISHTVVQMLFCLLSARAVLPAAQEPQSAGEYVFIGMNSHCKADLCLQV